jgi:hypothetical protein
MSVNFRLLRIPMIFHCHHKSLSLYAVLRQYSLVQIFTTYFPKINFNYASIYGSVFQVVSTCEVLERKFCTSFWFSSCILRSSWVSLIIVLKVFQKVSMAHVAYVMSLRGWGGEELQCRLPRSLHPFLQMSLWCAYTRAKITFVSF